MVYSYFGHTAIRVSSGVRNIDVVYNYGAFDFSTPNFLMKFLKGDLMYFLSVDSFRDFLSSYQFERRDVREQILRINCAESELIWNSLNKQLNSDSRFYKYNFLKDNCSTRIRDILFVDNSSINIVTDTTITTMSGREALHSYLEGDERYWALLGIDLLLGTGADERFITYDEMFLPEYLYRGINNSVTADGIPLVKSNRKLISYNTVRNDVEVRPILIFGPLSVLLLILSFLKYRYAIRSWELFSQIILFVSGLLGCVILFLWLYSDHSSFRNNFNVLWALPTNIFLPFLKRDTMYYRVVCFSLICVSVGILIHLFGVQKLNIEILPIILYFQFFYLRTLGLGQKSFSVYLNREIQEI